MLTILQGDAIEQLRTLPDDSVHCCVTSPPYWGLRDYGTAQWESGADDCDHRGRSQTSDASTLAEWKSGGGQRYKEETGGMPFARECGKCGAKRIDSQLGLEKTTEEYVAKMVEVFREVRRVLRKDGTLWLNLGDSYGGPAGNTRGENAGGGAARGEAMFGSNIGGKSKLGTKPKDLCGIPWRVAFALQADGWWLRSDIIWAKPNPMPESVTDRPTKAHEYLFLLTKSANYFYDAEAIKEQGIEPDRQRWDRIGGANGASVRHSEGAMIGASASRNKRSVWTVATAPYPEAHFATYPPDLIKPCILAGTSVGGIVLDPFAGSGTTGAVALELGRKAILIELNPKYIALIEQQCSITPGLALA